MVNAIVNDLWVSLQRINYYVRQTRMTMTTFKHATAMFECLNAIQM